MGKKSKGYRSKTRSLLRKNPRERGKIGLSQFLHEYKLGERVVVKINPTFHGGMPHRRYHGRVGVIMNKRGKAYVINVSQGEAIKEIIVHPAHIKPYSEG